VSNVNAVLACPSRSDTTLGDTPTASAIVAAVWRKSYSLNCGNPASLRIDLERLAKLSALIGCPDGVLNTKSMASEQEPIEIVSVRSLRRRATIQLCNLMGRRPRVRLVSQKHHLPFSLRMLRTTLIVCRPQWMS
jgi:hypothetical protein